LSPRGKDPLNFVISMNLRRRHLDKSQRAFVAAKIATPQQGRPEKAANVPVIPTQSQAADMLVVSERSVRSARNVLDKGTPDLQKAVEQGHLPVSAAAQANSSRRWVNIFPKWMSDRPGLLRH
jgi:hypothetical protein